MKQLSNSLLPEGGVACGTCSLGRGESDGLSLFAVGIVPVQGDKKYAFQGEKKYAMQGGEKNAFKGGKNMHSTEGKYAF